MFKDLSDSLLVEFALIETKVGLTSILLKYGSLCFFFSIFKMFCSRILSANGLVFGRESVLVLLSFLEGVFSVRM